MSESENPKPKKMPKKMGRPPLAPGTQKEFTLRVRMSVPMKDSLFVSARKQYLTASEFVRKLLEDKLGVK